MIADWVEGPSNGQTVFDRQKKSYFQRINNLLIAYRERTDDNEVADMMNVLKTCATIHFSSGDTAPHLDRDTLPEHREEQNATAHGPVSPDRRFDREGAAAGMAADSDTLTMDWVMDHDYRSGGMVAAFVCWPPKRKP